jgi:hypothetical protein
MSEREARGERRERETREKRLAWSGAISVPAPMPGVAPRDVGVEMGIGGRGGANAWRGARGDKIPFKGARTGLQDRPMEIESGGLLNPARTGLQDRPMDNYCRCFLLSPPGLQDRPGLAPRPLPLLH